MHTGDVIRQHRKTLQLTQEELANRIGVSAPAVNKWEKGHSLPDISLLSPIARLLGITTDELLCHQQNLSTEEADRLLIAFRAELLAGNTDDAYDWMAQHIRKYPNNHYLILNMARLFDAFEHDAQYDAAISDFYRRALQSDDGKIRHNAAESLYLFHLIREQYELAESYLSHFSDADPDRKLKQALICCKTRREDEAIKQYEELLYASYQQASECLNGLYQIAMADQDTKRAHLFAEKLAEMAKLYEFGEYHEHAAMLGLADEKRRNHTLRLMIDNIESIAGFMRSPLYAHMKFRPLTAEYFQQLRADLRDGLTD